MRGIGAEGRGGRGRARQIFNWARRARKFYWARRRGRRVKFQLGAEGRGGRGGRGKARKARGRVGA